MTTYKVVDGMTFKSSSQGEEMLANFNATIIQETKYVDGINNTTYLSIIGENETNKFPEIIIPAKDFATMSWVTPQWGVKAVLQPGQGIKEDMRTAIQLASQNAREVTIHTCLGWTKINGEWTYLHAEGGISSKGFNRSIQVQLPSELSKFILPKVKLDQSIHSHIKTSLSIMNLAPQRIVWPLLGATYRAAITNCDFSIHLAGKTGTYKTELCALIQSHFGEQMDARNLPGNWSSTANALEAQAFKARHAIFVIDDFVPTGTSWQRRQLEKTADQLIRAQGNQAGRARLTDVSHLQTTMYPRGLILSSGEDIPEGHSLRARLFILEIAPGDINLDKLTALQKNRQSLTMSMAGFIRWIAMSKHRYMVDQCNELSSTIRDRHLDIGHTRTPSTLGSLVAGAYFFIEYAFLTKTIDEHERDMLYEVAKEAITEAAAMQSEFLQTADPVETFTTTLQSMWSSRQCHCRTRDGGIPDNPQLVGWEVKDLADLPDFKPGGPMIGWIDNDMDELLLDATCAYDLIKKYAKGGLTLTKQTMIKRLKDAHRIKRADTGRGRNTIRLNCQGIPRNCISLSLSQTLAIEEIENA